MLPERHGYVEQIRDFRHRQRRLLSGVLVADAVANRRRRVPPATRPAEDTDYQPLEAGIFLQRHLGDAILVRATFRPPLALAIEFRIALPEVDEIEIHARVSDRLAGLVDGRHGH